MSCFGRDCRIGWTFVTHERRILLYCEIDGIAMGVQVIYMLPILLYSKYGKVNSGLYGILVLYRKIPLQTLAGSLRRKDAGVLLVEQRVVELIARLHG